MKPIKAWRQQKTVLAMPDTGIELDSLAGAEACFVLCVDIVVASLPTLCGLLD